MAYKKISIVAEEEARVLVDELLAWGAMVKEPEEQKDINNIFPDDDSSCCRNAQVILRPAFATSNIPRIGSPQFFAPASQTQQAQSNQQESLLEQNTRIL